MVLLLVCLAWALENNVKNEFFELPDHIRQKFWDEATSIVFGAE